MNTQLLSELFGGTDRYRALKCLFENPGRAFGARELASQAEIDPGNASRWLRRWADAGLLDKSYLLQRPRFQAGSDPALKPLQDLFQQDSDLVKRLRERIARLGDRVQAAAVFGSTAKGTTATNSDVDLLLLTDMSRLEAQAFFKPVGRSLRRPVNVLAYQPQAWARAVASENPLALDILNGPQIPLKGSVDAPK